MLNVKKLMADGSTGGQSYEPPPGNMMTYLWFETFYLSWDINVLLFTLNLVVSVAYTFITT